MEEKQFLTVPPRFQVTRSQSLQSPTLAELEDDDAPGLGYTHTLVSFLLLLNCYFLIASRHVISHIISQ